VVDGGAACVDAEVARARLGAAVASYVDDPTRVHVRVTTTATGADAFASRLDVATAGGAPLLERVVVLARADCASAVELFALMVDRLLAGLPVETWAAPPPPPEPASLPEPGPPVPEEPVTAPPPPAPQDPELALRLVGLVTAPSVTAELEFGVRGDLHAFGLRVGDLRVKLGGCAAARTAYDAAVAAGLPAADRDAIARGLARCEDSVD